MAKKQVIRLTEGDLHRIIKESVNKILNEITEPSLNRIASVWHGYENLPSDEQNKHRDPYYETDWLHKVELELEKNPQKFQKYFVVLDAMDITDLSDWDDYNEMLYYFIDECELPRDMGECIFRKWCENNEIPIF